jgi:hypothetical protein
MDWDLAIERHRGQLLNVVVELFAMIGLTEGGAIEKLSRPLYRQALRVLRTAESAVRRLIVAAARDIVVEPSPKRPARARPKISAKDKAKADGEAKAETKVKKQRGVLFKLFDPPKRFKKFVGRLTRRPRAEPRIRRLDFDPRIPEFLRSQVSAPAPAPAAPTPEEDDAIDDDTVNAGPLIRRLMAIKDALEDIPRQAMRLARWQARPIEERHPQRESPLRIGRPPGFRKRQIHEVDEILKECHWLARNVPALDSS